MPELHHHPERDMSAGSRRQQNGKKDSCREGNTVVNHQVNHSRRYARPETNSRQAPGLSSMAAKGKSRGTSRSVWKLGHWRRHARLPAEAVGGCLRHTPQPYHSTSDTSPAPAPQSQSLPTPSETPQDPTRDSGKE